MSCADSPDFSTSVIMSCAESPDFSTSVLPVITSCDESPDARDFSMSALVVAAALLSFRVSIEDDSNLGSDLPVAVSRENVLSVYILKFGFWVTPGLLGLRLEVEISLSPLDLAYTAAQRL